MRGHGLIEPKELLKQNSRSNFTITKKILWDCRLSFQQYIQSKDEKGHATECWWSMVRANLSKERRR